MAQERVGTITQERVGSREGPSRLSLWYRELRAPFFTAILVPILLGGTIAWARDGGFAWGYFLLTLMAGLALHAGTNVINDYFDHKSGADDFNFEFVRPYTGGSRLIQLGLLKPREVLAEALLMFAVGIGIGLLLVWLRGTPILWLGLVGFLSGFFYTAPPFYLTRTGLGEAIVGLNFGTLAVLGSYYVQGQQFTLEVVIASLPVALLIAAVLYINQFQDYNADRVAGKLNLVARLGRRRSVPGYVALMVLPYLIVIGGVASQVLSPYTLLALITFPIAWKAIRTARVHFDDYLKLTPANSATVMVHLLVGVLLSLGYVIHHLVHVTF